MYQMYLGQGIDTIKFSDDGACGLIQAPVELQRYQD